MQANVTEQGLVIPKALLEGVDKVEILKEGDRIVLVPVVQTDPIWNLGTNPTTCDVTDAYENLDLHLYGSI